jgi:hypothetical protein
MGGRTQSVGDFQDDQEEGRSLAPVPSSAPDQVVHEGEVERPKLPGDVVVKFAGQGWDLLSGDDLKIGREREFVVRAQVKGMTTERMATGVVRHSAKLTVIGVSLIPVAEEKFPTMPRGNYADQHEGKVPAGQMSLPDGDQEGEAE